MPVYFYDFWMIFYFFVIFLNGLASTWALMGESGEKGRILTTDVSSDRPMGSDHPLNPNFSHKQFLKKYSCLAILNRLVETNISICFLINRFFEASSLFLMGPLKPKYYWFLVGKVFLWYCDFLSFLSRRVVLGQELFQICLVRSHVIQSTQLLINV